MDYVRKGSHNSTLLRLVPALNQRAKARKRQSFNERDTTLRKKTPFKFSRYPTWNNMNSIGYFPASVLKQTDSSAFTMSRQRQFDYFDFPINHRGIYNFNYPSSLKLHTRRIETSMFHVIDSCGLVSGNGVHGTYMCSGNSANQSLLSDKSTQDIHKFTESDNLLPQCNPTCGFLSNPHRMKLVDVLALYEVNTDLLANILGLTTSELKSLDSEQQMRVLFCRNERDKGGLDTK